VDKRSSSADEEYHVTDMDEVKRRCTNSPVALEPKHAMLKKTFYDNTCVTICAFLRHDYVLEKA